MVPIALLVDDSCPLVHVFRYHWEDVHRRPPATRDGRPLADVIPNAFLDAFCDVCDRWNLAGKFSIVPAPAARGNIVEGIAGFPASETRAWLDTAVRRLAPRFDFTPEGITHNLAVDLATGALLPVSENDWSQTQTRETLTPYLIRELQLLKEAGIDATGFTSPWVFGIQVEPEYVAAMVAAQRAVYGRDCSWYFLHMIFDREDVRPWVAHQDARGWLVSIPASVPDLWWECIDDPGADPEGIAERLYARTVAVADHGGVPVVLTHWQSLFANGLRHGLQALDAFAARVAASGRFAWRRCSDLAAATAHGRTV